MTGMDETKEAQRAREAKANLAEILERRPGLKGKSIEAVPALSFMSAHYQHRHASVH
jgi:hypothetical protein